MRCGAVLWRETTCALQCSVFLAACTWMNDAMNGVSKHWFHGEAKLSAFLRRFAAVTAKV